MPPEGFDVDRMQAASQGLLRKRRRELLHAWPQLRDWNDDRFDAAFLAFAAVSPLPSAGGPLADGRLFLEFLAERRTLSDQVKLARLRFDLHYSRVRGSFLPRTGVVLRFEFLSEECRGILGVRLPWLGERVVKLPRFRRSETN